MKTVVSTVCALALGAASLAGCSLPPGGTPVVNPQVSTTEQTIYAWVCPVLLSGSLDSVAAVVEAATPNAAAAEAGAYADAKTLCSNGVIMTPGAFIADFLVIEPIVAGFFAKQGKSAEFHHYSKMAHRA